jgi:hypothetical protein
MLETYTVVGGPEGQAAAVRTAIDAVREQADKFECDLPLSERSAWPAEVIQAAEVLISASVATRGQSDDYRQTGILKAAATDLWDAFATFAPYAYDASVWNADGRVILSAADEGQSCVVLADLEALTRLRASGIMLEPLP